ncbi:oligosaccharide flippase family protein [Rhodococcus daqingensis]|uniref:Oligosaccharide flippase family protein n=1 Tax=Rhodococcus daqingensis TaxID=2479363 RepID=A0ABW2RRV2_9NOCA
MTTAPREIASDARAAARGTATVLASRVAIAAMGWAGSVVVARSLSADEWGQFSFVFVLLGLLSVVTDLGVGRVVLARLMDDDPDEVALTASSFVALRTLLGVVGYVVAVAYVLILGYPSEVVRATAIAGLVVLFATPGNALSVLFQSRHRLTYVAVAESLGQAVQLALTILAAIFAPYLLVFVIPAIVNELVALSWKSRGVHRKVLGVRPARRIEVARWREMLREALPLAIGFALTIALTKIDVLMLSLMDTFDAVGLYSIGYKFSDIMDTMALAVVAPVSTLLVAAWPARPEVFRRRSRDAGIAFGLMGAVAVASFWPSANAVIELLYGERFGQSTFAAQLLVVAAALTAPVLLGLFLLASAGHQRSYPLVAAGGLVLNIGLNLVLIPRYSFEGSAVATVATMAAMVVALWIVIARVVPIRGLLPVRAMLGLACVAAAVAATGQFVATHTPLPWPVVSALAAALVLALAQPLRLTDGIRPWAILKARRG